MTSPSVPKPTGPVDFQVRVSDFPFGGPAMSIALELRNLRVFALLSVLVIGTAGPAHAAGKSSQKLEIGLSGTGAVIEGARVEGSRHDAPTVVLIGGLAGNDASVAAVRKQLEVYAAQRASRHTINLISIPLANPD